MAKILIDGKEIEAEDESNLLQTCLDNEIFIPNLCYLKDMDRPAASCRLCFVEVDGTNITSCVVKVRDGMTVRTDTEQVRRLQKTSFELIMSDHRIECKVCPANKKCPLQNIAKFLKYGLKPKRIDSLEREVKIELEHPFLSYDPYKCILCGKCVYICKKMHDRPFLDFAKRGLNTYITFYGETDPENLPCDNCYACVDVCPVSALTRKKSV